MRMRTIDMALKEIRDKDANTCITRYGLKMLIADGKIPYRKAGRKFLIDLDDVERYFTNGGDA